MRYLGVCFHRRNFVDHDFLKAYHLSRFLKTVSPLAAWALQHVNYGTQQLKDATKAVKEVLGLFKLVKQSCNMQEQLISYRNYLFVI